MAMNPRLLRPLATGFNPRSIAGLEAWYAADVASSITIATGVSQWADLSGKGRNLTQSITNNQPAYNSVTLNGKPTVTFDGSNDCLVATFSLAQPYMFFLVMREESHIANGRFTSGRPVAGDPRSGEFFATATNSVSIFAGTTLGITNNALIPLLPLFNIWDLVFDGSSSAIRLQASGLSSTGNAGTNNLSGLVLGAAQNASSSPSNVSIAEFLVYSRSLPTAEAAKIRSYLGKKYNLAFA
jgi:hypothetical protein